MRNKSYSILLFAAILPILVPAGIARAFSGRGSGTEQDPYIITNVKELQAMNNHLYAWYELGNDIDASATSAWPGGAGFIPIGDSSNKFMGHFDGKGHTITGLYIDRPNTDYVGLFGCVYPAFVYSEIKDVGLVDIFITGRNYVGALIGGSAYTGSSMDSCTGCYTTGRVNGKVDVGGLIGLNGADISHCYSTASVDGDSGVGGLIGYCLGGPTNPNVTHCYSAGRVNDGAAGDQIGGLVGAYGQTRCISCYWDIETSGQETSAGGLGKTTMEMKWQVTFSFAPNPWDFENVWNIVEDVTYPYLRGVPPPIPTLKWPLAGRVSDRQVSLEFGDIWTWTYCGGLPKKHAGVDLPATKGEDVYAPEAGIVKAKVYNPEWKYCVTIEHSGFTTVCWHVDPLVNVGDNVTRGQIIGSLADLGRNTHLHFGVRASTYSDISNRGALPQIHGDSDHQDGRFTGCKSDPLFPEKFINPMTLSYEIGEPLPPAEVTPRPESQNPQPDSLAFDAPLLIFPVEPPSWYGEETWRGALIRLLDRFIGLLLPPYLKIITPVVPIQGVQARDWRGNNATAVTVAVAAANQTQTDAIKLSESSDAFIWKEVMIPKNAYGLTFDGIFLGDSDGDKLIVSFNDKTLFIDDGTLFSNTVWANPGIIYIEDLAGETGILQFRLKSEADPNASILITNITLTIYPQVGDLDGDMDVDLADLSTLNLHWLAQDCNYPDWCEGTDLNYNNTVDFADFALFAEKWLEGSK